MNDRTAPPPAPGTPPTLGTRFGPYRIDRVIGVGGMGMVYAATDERLGRQVALKVVLGHYAQSEDFVRRFQREAAILAQLDSPHVISIFDHGVEHGTPFIVTQYAAGGDLGKVLAARGALPPAVAVRAAAQLADALVAAHAVGVVHRDVKPANVLLRDDRIDRLHVYLSDFGVALTETSGLTVPGSVAGTWNYLAPERTAGEHGSPSSDLYSLGCVLWEVLTGDPPYAGSDVEVAMEHLNSPVPQLTGDDEFTREANAVLARSMAKRAEDRYGSAVEMRDALRSLGGGLGLTGSTPGSSTPGAAGPGGGATAAGGPGRRRRRGALVAGAVALALVVAGAGVGAAVLLDDGDGGTEDDAVTQPEPDPAVAGDVDGDGLGDLAWVYVGEDGFLRRSDGSGFPGPTESIAGAQDPSVLGDFDGDGTHEVLTLPDDTGSTGASVRATVITGPDSGTTSTVQVPRTSATVDPTYLAADLDGDGSDELVVAAQTRAGTTVQVSVSDGEGAFGTRRVLFEDDLPSGGFAAGDLDGDGDDDVLAAAAPDAFEGETGALTVLVADGGELTAGDPTEIDGDQSLPVGVMTDVDDDGADELVTLGNGAALSVWEYDDGGFGDPEVWWSAPQEQSSDLFWPQATDLDGDGTSEIVLLPYSSISTDPTGVTVLRVGDGAFETVEGAAADLDEDTSILPFNGSFLEVPF